MRATGGTGTNLTNKLHMVQRYVGSNDLADAFSTLTALIQKVNAQSSKKIPMGQAATLIASAQRIRTVLGHQRATQQDARTPMVSSDGQRWGKRTHRPESARALPRQTRTPGTRRSAAA